jgi:hypothetical protein
MLYYWNSVLKTGFAQEIKEKLDYWRKIQILFLKYQNQKSENEKTMKENQKSFGVIKIKEEKYFTRREIGK